MSLSSYFMSLQEGAAEPTVSDIEIPTDASGFGADDSGFSKPNDDQYGELKMDKPEEEGFEAAKNAANQFTHSSDGQGTDVNMVMNVALPKDTSGFSEAVEDDEVETSDEIIDPNTVPAVPEEDDQFSDPTDPEENPAGTVSDAELASDDEVTIPEESIEESFTGWDDLF